jgi:cation:H+ antiporter
VSESGEEAGLAKGPVRPLLTLARAVALVIPGTALAADAGLLGSPARAFILGLAMVGAALMLSWAAEAAQVDVSSGVAMAVVALVAVMPEYAVDLVFAIRSGNAFEAAGHEGCSAAAGVAESPCSLVLANMTGSNRLLVGVGWTLVAAIVWRRARSSRDVRHPLALPRSRSVEVAFLLAATLYALTIPLRRSLTLIDSAVLLGIFGLYTVRLSRAPSSGHSELVGMASWIGGQSTWRRRALVIALLSAAGAVIGASAGPFAEALVATGVQAGVDEFALVQWLSPLASEAPELLVAAMYAWRSDADSGLGMLISAKISQWTLLLATVPIAFALASGSSHGLPLVPRQRAEVLLTAALSIVAVAVIVRLHLSRRGIGLIALLFLSQLLIGAAWQGDEAHTRVVVALAAAFGAIGGFLLVRRWASVRSVVRDGMAVSWDRLGAP